METLAYLHVAVEYENSHEIMHANSEYRRRSPHCSESAICDRFLHKSSLSKFNPSKLTGREARSQLNSSSSIWRPQRSRWRYVLASAFALGIWSIGNGAIAQILSPGETLGLGSTGSQVIQLQQALRARGLLAGPADGIYGPQTEAAVSLFQQNNQLFVDGEYGPATDAALFGVQPRVTVPSLPRSTQNTFANAVPGTRVLRLSSRGEDVRELQRLLNNEDFYFGDLDGIFGSATERAVEAFQAANGLSVDGVVGPETWRALGVSVTPNPDSGVDIALDEILRQGRYVVVVPGNDPAELNAIRRELGRPSYRTRSGRGSFLTSGGYTTYRAARNDVLRLRAVGLDARVEHF